MTPTPAPGEHNPDGRTQQPRRVKGWAITIGVLILLGLLGYLLNQQRASRRTVDTGVESQQPQSPPPAAAAEKKPETVGQSPTPRQRAEDNAARRKPLQVTYMVTHKHRLRDCHGTLTFTRAALRFESDEPEDSFAVGFDDVAVKGDTLRIRDKTWRFEFRDAVRAERVYQDWKTGTLFKR